MLNMLAVVDIFQARIDLGADNTAYPESAAAGSCMLRFRAAAISFA